jgi:hypothetical protein
MKILLVATNRMMTPFPVYPIGVDYVATALRGRHDVQVMDFACDGAEAALASACQTWRPDVVGLSIRNIDNVEAESPLGFIPEIERIVGLIRAQSTARIVLGGPGFSIFPDALMARLHADFGVVGEGERLAELLDALATPALSSAAVIPGVFAGNHRLAPPEPWLGPRARALTSPETVTHYLRWGGMLNVQTKRGCPYLCSYCTYPGIEGRKLRLFEPDDVADEWEALVKAGAKFLFVTDSVFNSHVRTTWPLPRLCGAEGSPCPGAPSSRQRARRATTTAGYAKPALPMPSSAPRASRPPCSSAIASPSPSSTRSRPTPRRGPPGCTSPTTSCWAARAKPPKP